MELIINAKASMQFGIRIITCLLLVGCSSSQEDVLGAPPTTTQAVMDEVINNQTSKAERWKSDNIIPTEDGLRRYHSHQNMGEWIPQAKYVENERLLIYVYPKRDAVGGIIPGHALEIPLYKEVHIIMPGEY